jgi:hypothetical protein
MTSFSASVYGLQTPIIGFATLIVNLPVNQELQVPVDLSRDIQIRLERNTAKVTLCL